jgi:hypothetical protein
MASNKEIEDKYPPTAPAVLAGHIPVEVGTNCFAEYTPDDGEICA